jgi:hypothetical protein
MARAHYVAKARKDNPAVKKGQPYYWWQFRTGGPGIGPIRSGAKHYSATPPRASQLTQSAYLGGIADIQDEIADLEADDGLEDRVTDIAERIRELGNEQEEKLENMPDGLKEAPTGQMLQERKDACEAAADELEAITFDVESKDDEQTVEEYWQEKLDEVQAVSLD